MVIKFIKYFVYLLSYVSARNHITPPLANVLTAYLFMRFRNIP